MHYYIHVENDTRTISLMFDDDISATLKELLLNVEPLSNLGEFPVETWPEKVLCHLLT